MNKERTKSLLLIVFFVFASTLAQTGKYPGAEVITASQLKTYLSFIASDELEGRDTPSKGLDIAAKFLAVNLSRWGFKPAGDNGTYFQNVELTRMKVDPEQTRVEFDGKDYRFGDDFIASFAAGMSSPGTVTGQLVYVGHGWYIKNKGINAYDSIDVKDKIVVICGLSIPKGASGADLTGKVGEDWDNPRRRARALGAKGAIIVPSPGILIVWKDSRRILSNEWVVQVEKFVGEKFEFPTIFASPGLVNALFRGESVSGQALLTRAATNEPGAPFDLKNSKKVTISVVVRRDKPVTQNVVAVLEGSDNRLRNEYVALGAHYDHLGMRTTPVNGDSIYNGADDDGSGTTAVLALAEALAKGERPKRSMLFVWHCGEEKGLWGSRYFTTYPTVPLKQIVTQLNIDMIGRSKKANDTLRANAELSGPNEIYVIGSKMMSSQVGELTESVNKSYQRLIFNFKYDDPADPNRFFFRSDHFHYANHGIPAVFFFDGEHEDYHRPGDEVDRIDFNKMMKVTKTVYALAWELANTRTRPVVDKELPQELTRNPF